MKTYNRYIVSCLLLIAMWALGDEVKAQESAKDTIRTEAVIIGGDTLPYWLMPSVEYGQFIGSTDRRREIDRLRARVIRVYPYALQVKHILAKIDYDLGANAKKRDRKRYLDALDKELTAQYKDELKDLSRNDGQVLVKLINRETGKDVYSLVKELKGGFNARVYQTAFKFFDNNLKMQYDPYGADKDIEMIVKDLENRMMYRAAPISTKPAVKK